MYMIDFTLYNRLVLSNYRIEGNFGAAKIWQMTTNLLKFPSPNFSSNSYLIELLMDTSILHNTADFKVAMQLSMQCACNLIR